MANDRVMIKCKFCGGWKMLLKYFPGGSTHRDNGILEWLDTHAECHPHAYDVDLDGDPGFILLAENAASGDDLSFEKQNMEGPGNKERKLVQVWLSTINSMSLDELKKHYKEILRTRKPAIVYGIPGHTVEIERTMARDYVCSKLMWRVDLTKKWQ